MKHKPWDRYFINMAKVAASMSSDDRVQVGCVIVDEKKRILATGYNGTPSGYDDSNVDWTDHNFKKKVVVHAEQNALLFADGTKVRGATLYTTHSPCLECAKLIAGAGIKKVVFDTIYQAESLNLLADFGVESFLCKTELVVPRMVAK